MEVFSFSSLGREWVNRDRLSFLSGLASPWYLLFAEVPYYSRCKREMFQNKILFHWNLMIYSSWHIWHRSIHFRQIQMVVLFPSASTPGTPSVISVACRGHQTSCWGFAEVLLIMTPPAFYRRKTTMIVLDLRPHIFFMKNFKFELFSIVLSVSSHLKNHDSEMSAIFFLCSSYDTSAR